ncbi:MAG: FtsW/RodA/SpoVE family cell cycle protein [Candidatus Onthomonas sp.]|nr:FtsW/RodA/SpoVE family cell cycle protein [Candidatus Onthomonas sp.]
MSAIRDLIWDAIRQADHVLLSLCVAANLYGIALIYSATRWKEAFHSFPLKQGIAMLIGIGLYFVVSQFNIQLLMDKWRWVVLGCTLFLLLLRTPLGVSANGNRAWLHIPGIPFNIQPAEIVKLFFTMLLAYLLIQFKNTKELSSVPSVAKLAGVLLYFCGLIFVLSSDAGSALIYVFIFIFMVWVAGLKRYWFALGIAFCAVVGFVGWHLLSADNRWKARILVCLDHDYDPQGVGFHQTRSYLAIRSGGLTGQGYLNGSLVQSKYSSALPERYNDFIFSSCAQELGLIGCTVIILLLAAIIIRCLYVASVASDTFSSLVCVGYGGMLIAQVALNIGMCLYVLPVIGITLPFFSYGGSSIITMYITMGIISGIRTRSRPNWLKDHPSVLRGGGKSSL